MAQIKCPECGAPLEILEDKDYQFCQYCGAKIENKASNMADAAVKIARMRYEYEAKEREREEKENDKNTKKAVIIFGSWFIICMIALLIISFFKK